MKNNEYKVVFQLSNNDTFVQKSLLRQITNLLNAMAGVRVEVVMHSYGIDLLLADSPFRENVEDLRQKGVEFLVCENTIRSEKISPSELAGVTRVVPAGLAHIIQRQGEGWGYIKAGY